MRDDTLTPARARVLTALKRAYEAKQGARGCTVREVMLAAGLTSPSTAQAHLLTLERLGWADREPGPPGGGHGTWIPAGYHPPVFVPLVTVPPLPAEEPSEPHEQQRRART